ncbi:Ku protein [Parvibaculum sp.]|uniref:non-homologous end joining protein Ku n=1 Tax=Parvibaculum sp. TaxID=2024848 RepID=UPI002C45FB32|nr:Ku protein [Parvibaculum sp.]HUD51484.1 Ku protein [Parvibaculum sp.]
MAARPSWRGYLKLSLVSCAVELYPASTRSDKISFHMLNRETGNRLRQQMIDEKTHKPVDTDDRVKGYEVGKRQYITVEDEELEAIEIESTKTMEIESFVSEEEIDPIYLDGAHYLVPEDKVAEEAFAVIRDAMQAKKMVGIARVVLHQRERIMMLAPRDRGLLAITIRYPYEVREADPYFDKIPKTKVPAEMLDIASDIIERKVAKFDPKTYEDRYETALTELLQAKKAGRKITHKKIGEPKPAGNLMDALKKSLAGESGRRSRPAARAKPAPRRTRAPAHRTKANRARKRA